MKKHPLSWFMERYEHFIDVGTVFAIAVIAGIVVLSVMSGSGDPSYFDRPFP
jgi:hypothetical protein